MKRKKGWLPVFLLPAVALFLLIYAVPLVIVFVSSLFDYRLTGDSMTFIGLQNYTQLFSDATFRQACGHTVVWILIHCIIHVPIGVILAVLEAARVDGATSFQTDMFVVLPLLRKIIGTTMVMAATYMLQMFDLIYITTKGGPGSTTMNLPLMLYSVYKNENNYGYSNAIGVCIVIAGVVCMTLINKAMRVNEEDY